jgi:hypothetical protein
MLMKDKAQPWSQWQHCHRPEGCSACEAGELAKGDYKRSQEESSLPGDTLAAATSSRKKAKTHHHGDDVANSA